MDIIVSDTPIDNLGYNVSDDIKYISLTESKFSNCVGCFGCWVKTPSKCVMRDDMINIYPVVASSKRLMYISRVKYGSYDTMMKTFVERLIPIQQPFIRLHNMETHHVQRNVELKEATIIAYGDIIDEEKQLFSKLIDRNAHNMNFDKHRVIFVADKDLQKTVEAEVMKWQKQ